MARIYTLHPQDPQARTIAQIRQDLWSGAVMLYPTDTVYAIGCDLNSKAAVQRVRQLKQWSNDKPLTFLCPSLSNIAKYAYVQDGAYRIMRRLVPGPYTFILPATKLVPKLVLNPQRKTTGIRVPDHPVCQAILSALDAPVISTSANLPETYRSAKNYHTSRQESKAELFDCFEKHVDVIVDNEQEPAHHVSTILDLCGPDPVVIRAGLGWEEIAQQFAQV
jgi:tRNA threonylcarbamoyl adenosine modification protein (Sua5/YciO/YrdC/YwlC family)